MLVLLIFGVFSLTIPLSEQSCEKPRPNIVIILADDMGWNDVSSHGSNQILTPNIDALAYDGIILNRHYVPPMCTPSRAALLTGKYPIHTGMQHYVIVCDEPWGLGLHEKLMPEIFQAVGYKTHLVGKWHLGFHEKEYTPTFRGFDEHIGFLGAYVDYFDHNLIDSNLRYARGHDMRRNLTMDEASRGTYATTLFSIESERIIMQHDTKDPLFLMINHLAPHSGNEDDPMQAPESEIEKFAYIKDPNRRILAAMISLLDQSVGELVKNLEAKAMLDNTIILFLSDNGAPTLGQHGNFGSNFPFKGQKNRPFEGAVRVPALIWSRSFQNTTHRVSNQFVHNVDWFPTLAEAAQLSLKDIALDGKSHWESFVNNRPGGRREILNAIDDLSGYNSIMIDGWKLVDERLSENSSTFEVGAGWVGEIDETDSILTGDEYFQKVQESVAGKLLPLGKAQTLTLREEATVRCNTPPLAVPCDSLTAPCLFNVVTDPCEFNNLAADMPWKVRELIVAVQDYREGSEPLRNQPKDPACDPKFHDFTWTWWKESQNVVQNDSITDYFDDLCLAGSFWSRTVTMDIFIIVAGSALLTILAMFIFMNKK